MFGIEFAAHDNDTSEIRSEKNTIFLVAVACSLAGIVWAAMYWTIFGWSYTTALPLAFVVIVGISIVAGHLRRDHRITIVAQLFAITMIPALIQWSVGGLGDSGLVMVWALLGPLGALMFYPPRGVVPWVALYLLNLVITVALDGWLSERALDVGSGTRRLFFAMNLGVSSVVVLGFAGYFVVEAVRQRTRANQLLLNVLPASIAERLKETSDTIAESHESVSVLFADIVGSTPLFAGREPTEVVEWLNEIFSALDDVVERHGLEKLRTMGDNFMVGSGVPQPRDDHAVALVTCALEMIEAVERLPQRHGTRIQLRYGINSGAVVAGVIGKSKFHYDMWGDMVNVASRMESSGEVGRIQVSHDTYGLIKHAFECESRGQVEIKGKGAMTTWWVVGPA